MLIGPRPHHCSPIGRALLHSSLKTSTWCLHWERKLQSRQYVGSIAWAFRRLKKPRCREMSARGYELHSACPQLSFLPSPDVCLCLQHRRLRRRRRQRWIGSRHQTPVRSNAVCSPPARAARGRRRSPPPPKSTTPPNRSTSPQRPAPTRSRKPSPSKRLWLRMVAR